MYILYLAMVFSLLSCSSSDPSQDAYLKYMDKQTKFIYSKYGLLTYGLGGFNENGIKGYSFSFASYNSVKVDEARKLIVSIFEDILKDTNSTLTDEGKPLKTVDYFQITIAFYDKETQMKFLKQDGIANVMLIKREISYCNKINELGELECVLKEPYSEAYEKVTGQKFVENETQNSIE